jgi:tRNA (guanine-N7-)-methyltransferase
MSEKDPQNKNHRPIRSFVLRKGRLTDAQSRALDELWPAYGIDQETGEIDIDPLFGRSAPLVIEIGFGNGDATWQMALDEPDKNFIGIEVHKPGVGVLLQALEKHKLSNVRVARDDAVDFIRDRIPAGSIDEVRIYFPDPWHKKRHHKRRIIQPAFLDLLATKMKSGGMLHLATDWIPYAEHMIEVCGLHPAFDDQSQGGDYSQRPDWRPQTKYESRGDRLGHRTSDILMKLK